MATVHREAPGLIFPLRCSTLLSWMSRANNLCAERARTAPDRWKIASEEEARTQKEREALSGASLPLPGRYAGPRRTCQDALQSLSSSTLRQRAWRPYKHKHAPSRHVTSHLASHSHITWYKCAQTSSTCSTHKHAHREKRNT